MTESRAPKSRAVRSLVLSALILAALGMTLVLVLRAGNAVQAPDKAPWWAWWSWADGWFGVSWHGAAVGPEGRAITGSDHLVSQVRALPPFHAVRVHGPIDIVLRQSGHEAASIHTDDNIAPLIRTEVTDGELRIDSDEGVAFRTRHAIGVTLDLGRIDRLEVAGNGDVISAQLDAGQLAIEGNGTGRIRFDNLHATDLRVLVQGAREVSLAGSADQQQFEVNGAARIDAGELVGQSAQVVLNGAGDVSLWINRLLEVTINGAGRVRYRGAARVQSDIHGIGVVEHQ